MADRDSIPNYEVRVSNPATLLWDLSEIAELHRRICHHRLADLVEIRGAENAPLRADHQAIYTFQSVVHGRSIV